MESASVLPRSYCWEDIIKTYDVPVGEEVRSSRPVVSNEVLDFDSDFWYKFDVEEETLLHKSQPQDNPQEMKMENKTNANTDLKTEKAKGMFKSFITNKWTIGIGSAILGGVAVYGGQKAAAKISKSVGNDGVTISAM